MIKSKNFKSIFLTSLLTIGVLVITSQNAFAATITAKSYTVKSGDCLYTIAQKYEETLNNLRRNNNIWNNLIFPEQILKVSVTTSSTVQQKAQKKGISFKNYTIKKGDYLSLIAKKYGMSLSNLRKANNKWNDTIFPGQVLNVSIVTGPVIQQTIHLRNKKASSTIASYKTKYTMNATAYTGGSLTAMGLKPVRNLSGISTIAVDPSVIPLGTKVYIPGYGNAICSDTGSSIKGNIIDLYMNSEVESLNWVRRTVTLYIR
jgi:3D (Asp-Asp-Asp) domain-containing protein